MKKACRHWRRQAFLRNATLTRSEERRRRAISASGDDLGGDTTNAGTGQADGAGGTRGQIEDAATDERAAVIDGDDDALAAMGDAQPGAERQRAVGRGHGALVEALAGSGPAAGFIAVEGGHSREAVAGAGADRGVGIAPIATGGLGDMVGVVVMTIVMPGFGRSFGDAAADQESCGDQSKRRARPGYRSRPKLIGIQH